MTSSLFLILSLVCEIYSSPIEDLSNSKIMNEGKEPSIIRPADQDSDRLNIEYEMERLKEFPIESPKKYEIDQEYYLKNDDPCLKYEGLSKSERPTLILITNHFFEQKTFIYKCREGRFLGTGLIDGKLFDKTYEESDTETRFTEDFQNDQNKYQSNEFNSIQSGSEILRNKRKTQFYYDFMIYTQIEHNGCIGCGVVNYPYWNYLMDYDLDEISYRLLIWSIKNKTTCAYCPYSSICQIEISLLAVMRFMNTSIIYIKNRICFSYFESRYFYFEQMNAECLDKYTNLTMLFIDYHLACLSHFSISNSIFFNRILVAKTRIENFLTFTFRSGWMPIGSLINYKSSVFKTNTYIDIMCTIGAASNFSTLKIGECDSSNKIILKTFIRFVNLSAFSDIVSINYTVLGYTETLNEVSNSIFSESSWITDNPSTSYETISLNVYSDITNEILFYKDVPKSFSIYDPFLLILKINIGTYLILPKCQQSSCNRCQNFTYCDACSEGYYNINGTCYNCTSKCQSCSSLNNCNYCFTGYFLNSSDQSCLKCGNNCSSCNDTYCYWCSLNTARDPYNPKKCLPCLDINCQYCNSNFDDCTECKVGLGVKNKVCVNCSDINCIYCSSNYSSCSSCKSGYFLNYTSRECLACPSNCIYCYSDLYCYRCIEGFYLNENKTCTACHPDCLTCNSNSSCLSCKSLYANTFTGGIYWQNNSSRACKCNIGYGIKDLSTGLQCASCDIECNLCNYSTICTSCKSLNTRITNGICQCNPGYYNNTSLICLSSCLKCPIDCLECDSNGYCTSCISNNTKIIQGSCVCSPGFYNVSLLNNSNSCIPCSGACQECISESICTSCRAQYSIIRNGSCLCVDGYFGNLIASSDTCKNCHNECNKCLNDSMCVTCKYQNMSPSTTVGCDCNLGYYKNTSGQCMACHHQCLACDQFFMCVNCSDANAIPLLSGGCKCLLGFFNESNGVCTPCLPECETCSDSMTCLSCKDINSQLNQEGRCQCLKSFYPNISAHYFECVSCSEECLTCNSKGQCIDCLDPNSEPFDLSCKCKIGFYLNETSSLCEACQDFCMNCTSFNNCHSCINPNSFGDNCTDCHASCKTCEGPEEFQCTSCDFAYQNGFCFKSCVLGYLLNEHNCVLQKPGSPVLRYNFEGLGSVFYDTIHAVEATVVMKDKARSLQNEYGLITSYKRGIYFTGISSLRVRFKDQHLLTSNFSISIWMRPSLSSGTILIKYGGLYLEDSNNQEIEFNLTDSFNSTFDLGLTFNSTEDIPELFQIKLREFQVLYNVVIGNITCSVSSVSLLSSENWAHILTKTIFVSDLSLSLTVNNVIQESKSFDVFPFRDPIFSDMFIAGDAHFRSMVIGYYHLLEVFPAKENLDYINSQTISTSCSGCSICPSTKICIPNCEPDEFYDISTKKCGRCPAECPTGCKNENSCNLCVDQLCVGCATFEEKSCTECEVGYQPVNWLCEKCGMYTFFDMITKRCISCSGLCKTCKGENICVTCKENSSLNDLQFCECKFGYEGNTICKRKTFTTSFWVNQENVANFQFSKKLMKNLDDSFLKVTIDEKNVDFSIETSDFKYFQMFLKSTEIKDASILDIHVILEIVADDNSLLVNKTFQAELKVTKALAAAQELKVKAAAAKETAKTGATAGVSLAVGISLFNFDPSSFFDFLNTAEMFYSVYLDNFELNSILTEFLLGLRIQESIPNLFNYIIGDRYGSPVSKKMKKFGYKSNLVLMNIGVHIQMLALLLVLALLVFLLSKIKLLEPKLKGIRKAFKFGVFLRFWIQSYFEILIACTLGVRTNTFENGIQIFDYCCCLLFLVRFTQVTEICGVIYFLYLFRKRSKLVEEQKIKEFINKFGIFFDEFKGESLGYWYFYIFYIFRRSFLVIFYCFVSDGILQLSVSIVFSLSVFFMQIPIYIAFTRCFKLNIYNVFHFLNEIIIGIYHCCILVYFIRGKVKDSEIISNICLNLIFTAWAMNIGVSLFNTTKNVIDRIKKCRERRRKKIAKVYRLDKTTDVSSIHSKTFNETYDFPKNK